MSLRGFKDNRIARLKRKVLMSNTSRRPNSGATCQCRTKRLDKF